MAATAVTELQRSQGHNIVDRELPFESLSSGHEDISDISEEDEMNHRFIYPKLNLSRQEFRLLQLLPSSESSSIQFLLYPVRVGLLYDIECTALSYEWGSFDVPNLFTVYVNGQEFEIRENVYWFLQTMRSEGKRTMFFIDAICIDQSNVNEKGHQVNLMTKIYEGAKEVIAWLGTPLSCKVDLSSLEEELPLTWSGKQMIALERLCSVSYWERLWVVQEIVLAKSIVVYCGSWNRTWSEFRDLYWSMLKRRFGTRNRATSSIGAEKFFRYTDSTDDRTKITWKRKLQLHEALDIFGAQKCYDLRDKVYGLLGLLESVSITPDYSKSIEEVYADILPLGLAAFREARLQHQAQRQILLFAHRLLDVFQLRPEDQVIGSLTANIFRDFNLVDYGMFEPFRQSGLFPSEFYCPKCKTVHESSDALG